MSKKLLSLILLFSLIILSLSTRNLLEESQEKDKEKEEEPKEKDEEESPCDEPKEEKEVDFSKIHESQIRKENLPHSQVLMPIRRIGTSNMEIGHAPCGGVEKKSANTLTNKGSAINVVWEILVPEYKGNCTVKISNGNQDVDTLQWKWTTSYGDIYSCSDIIINGGSLTNCMGKCLNGGSCFNGKCLCEKGYEGDFCEDKIGEFSLTWLWVLLGIAALGGAGYACYRYRDNLRNLIDRGKSWLTQNGRNNSLPFNEESKNPDNNIIEDNSKQS